MSSNAIDSQGIVIAVGDGAETEAFTTIPEVKSFSGPGGSASVVDVTDLQSAAKEKRMGLQDEGQLTLSINYIPDNAVHQGLRTDRANQTKRNFRMTFTDTGATVWDFAAFVTGFSVRATYPRLSFFSLLQPASTTCLQRSRKSVVQSKT